MLKPEHWWWNAARVEIDQRARDARLRLEQIERLLISGVLPTRPLPRPMPRRRGLRFFRGGCVQTRSTRVLPPGLWRRQTCPIPIEVCIAARRTLSGESVGRMDGS
jgi:hypothetical protein